MSPQPSQPGPAAGERPSLSPQSFVADLVERLFFRAYGVIIPVVLLLRIGFEYAYFGTAPELLVDQIKILVEVCILCFIALFNHGCTTVPVLLQQLFSAAGPIQPRPDQPLPGSFFRHLQADLNSHRRVIIAALAALGSALAAGGLTASLLR